MLIGLVAIETTYLPGGPAPSTYLLGDQVAFHARFSSLQSKIAGAIHPYAVFRVNWPGVVAGQVPRTDDAGCAIGTGAG
jgi:hypothetical protein